MVAQDVLVIGGGVAGIQAALDLADKGVQVHLVERTPSIGGKMALLDKTFPTNDCSICILAPKMADCFAHPNVNVLTYSEVAGVEGGTGNFKVCVLRKARYVDEEKCTGCGDCIAKCPIKVPNETDMRLGMRKAIYYPFPQAVPRVAVIDRSAPPPCQDTCPAHVTAQGYIAPLAERRFADALRCEKERNPLPGVCGRVCTHPCEKECTRNELLELLKTPQSVKRLAEVLSIDPHEILKQITVLKKRGVVVMTGVEASTPLYVAQGVC